MKDGINEMVDKRVNIINVSEIEGHVILAGFVHELRDMAKIKFILLRDWTGIVQCIIKDQQLFDKFSELNVEDVLIIEGSINNANIKSEGVIKNKEIEIANFKIISKSQKPLPIPVSEKGVETSPSKKLDWRSLDLRKVKNNIIFKIQSQIVKSMQSYLLDNGFIQVFTPCLIGSPSESGAEVFSVNYYDRKAYLRQDPQLHRQLTILGGLERIYDLGPNWRAELSHTTKHLTEHRTIAAELAFTNTDGIIKLQKEIITKVINDLNSSKWNYELKRAGLKIDARLIFPIIDFSEAKKIVHGDLSEDFTSEEQKQLTEYMDKQYHADFYFVKNFPFSIKPFYVYHEPDNKKAESIDLFFRDIELSSGGMREHRYSILMQNLKQKGLNEKNIEWFTKFFRYGTVPHGGFAIGIERLTQALLSIKNIKQAVLFPRDPERLLP